MTHSSTPPIYTKKERQSNLELFRIFLMLMIIAHHYVVNSGIKKCFDPSDITANMIFLQLFGGGGKIGINCFLLITGYFMCKQQITLRKFMKLFLEVKFYYFSIFLIFLLTGYELLSASRVTQLIFNISYELGKSFTSGYMLLFFLIPFVNVFINATDGKTLLHAIATLMIAFTVTGTLLDNDFYEYSGWYVAVYLMGAYIRLYPSRWTESLQPSIWMTVISTVFACASVLALTYLSHLKGTMITTYYMVNDSNKLLAIASALSLFLLFKNIPMRQNRVVNLMAQATFGVLLIHANSNAMRQWLWRDLLDVPGQYASATLWVHAVFSVAAIYMICVCIDLARIYLLERPVFALYDRIITK